MAKAQRVADLVDVGVVEVAGEPLAGLVAPIQRDVHGRAGNGVADECIRNAIGPRLVVIGKADLRRRPGGRGSVEPKPRDLRPGVQRHLGHRTLIGAEIGQVAGDRAAVSSLIGAGRLAHVGPETLGEVVADLLHRPRTGGVVGQGVAPGADPIGAGHEIEALGRRRGIGERRVVEPPDIVIEGNDVPSPVAKFEVAVGQAEAVHLEPVTAPGGEVDPHPVGVIGRADVACKAARRGEHDGRARSRRRIQVLETYGGTSASGHLQPQGELGLHYDP